MMERELKIMLDHAERRGINQGIKIMQQRMLLACENDTPIEIDGEAYFIYDAISNLRGIFSDLEADAD